MSGRTRWIVAIVIGVLVVVVGGPFVYIHFIEGKAPAKLALSATPSAAATVPLDGTWSVTTGSQAGYRVGEVIFGQNNTAVGRTGVITGTIAIKGNTATAGSFTADLTAVKSDESQRDGQFQRRIMDTAKYPTATFALTRPITFSAPVGEATTTATATGNLTLHGVTRPVTFTVTARRNGTILEVLGSIPVVFADWSIPNPSLAGVVTTADHGTLEFLLVFAKGTIVAAATPTTSVTSTTSGSHGGPSSAAGAAYRACLAAHGVTLPGPGQGAGPGGPPGGPGGGGPGVSVTPQMQAAQAACASLRPSGGFTRPTISPTTVPPLGL